MDTPHKVGILLFDDVDLLDVGGPYEVFLTADRLSERNGDGSVFDVRTVSATDAPVTSYGGMGLAPSHRMADVVGFDVLVVPGAIAIEDVARRPEVAAAVKKLIGLSDTITSVCTGAFLLADQGLLDGISWTTHAEDIEPLAKSRKLSGGTPGARWVDQGRVVTAGGLSNGMAMALHMVDRLAGRDLAVATASQISFPWTPE